MDVKTRVPFLVAVLVFSFGCGDDAAVVAPQDGGPPANDAASLADAATDATAHSDADASVDASIDASVDAPTRPGWRLVWSDEFNAPDGTPADATKWNQETGNSGWTYNQERQYYTPGTANAVQRGGALVITATTQGASQLTCEYGPCRYTSARFNSQNKFAQKYGRFEARIQITRTQGLWPAFWMLGDDIGSKGWPTCGEIDIMENIGKEPAKNHGSLHGPGYSGGGALTGAYTLASGALADAFHVYAAEWEAGAIRFYVDDTLYETRTPADVPNGSRWVYDHPFFIVLNVAVGGNFPGDPDNTTILPQEMKVDYVRVYAR